MPRDTYRFAPYAVRMQEEGLPYIFIRTFEHYYEQLLDGHTGLIAESDIRPVGDLPDVKTFSPAIAELGENALPLTVMLKLNGGLGTSMGLSQAKSLLTVKDDLTFLDIIARQALHIGIPLVLMNSFATHQDSLDALRQYPDLWGDIPLAFLQHKAPKISQADYSPIRWPKNPALEWNPPGHGDIYTALITSNMLDILLDAGYYYAFVSNADNLGAVLDTRILGHFVENQLPFLMEVADRTPADRKGGHLARLPNGQLILRESAQCPLEDAQAFQDITRHRYFNTNNLWISLPVLKEVITAKDGVLDLPMIRNSKTVDPRDSRSPRVFQLETAMGSAIAMFARSGAVRVPRSRFAPVKTTNDLLAVRSDAYILTDDFRVITNPARKYEHLGIDLDEAYYKLIDDMEARFPYGPPSLVACESMTVKGDVCFGRNVIIQGNVRVDNPTDQQMHIADDTILAGETA